MTTTSAGSGEGPLRARTEWTRSAWSPAVFAALLGLAAVIRLGVVVNRALDPDESQHLHSAWLVAQGRVPFLDFWEHHAPLFYYLFAPLTTWFAERPAVYLAGRAVMCGAAAVALTLTWQLGRRVSIGAAAGAVAMLAVLPQFSETSTEIRPDPLALVAWLVALEAVTRWAEGGLRRWLWAAGLAQGLAVALSLKAVSGAAALGVTVALVAWTSRRPGRGPGAAGLAVFGLVGGGIVSVAGVGAWVGATGGAPAVVAMAHQVVGETWRFVDFSKARPLFGSELGFLALALTGIGLTLGRYGLSAVTHPIHAPLLVPLVVVTTGLLLPRTPAVYQQAWLPLLPLLAVYAGLGLNGLLQRARSTGRAGPIALAGLAVVVGLVIPAGESLSYAVRDRLHAQLYLMRRELEASCPGEPVLDGTALYVFRPAAYRYGVLITGVREWIARGVVAEEQIEQDLRRSRARVAYPDKRLRALIGPVADFLASRYVPGADGLLVAGARIRVPGDPPGGRASVDLLVPGPYQLTADPGIEVAIDARPARRGWVPLDAGRHEVAWRGPAGTIGLAAVPCRERWAAGGR